MSVLTTKLSSVLCPTQVINIINLRQ
jgi:hypothetical protein